MSPQPVLPQPCPRIGITSSDQDPSSRRIRLETFPWQWAITTTIPQFPHLSHLYTTNLERQRSARTRSNQQNSGSASEQTTAICRFRPIIRKTIKKRNISFSSLKRAFVQPVLRHLFWCGFGFITYQMNYLSKKLSQNMKKARQEKIVARRARSSFRSLIRNISATLRTERKIPPLRQFKH